MMGPPNENADPRAGGSAVSPDVRLSWANDADITENLPSLQSVQESWLQHRRHLPPLRARLIAEMAINGGVR